MHDQQKRETRLQRGTQESTSPVAQYRQMQRRSKASLFIELERKKWAFYLLAGLETLCLALSL